MESGSGWGPAVPPPPLPVEVTELLGAVLSQILEFLGRPTCAHTPALPLTPRTSTLGLTQLGNLRIADSWYPLPLHVPIPSSLNVPIHSNDNMGQERTFASAK